jgi:hypothetical protein
VDIAWKDGKLTTARLTPSQSGPIKVRLGDKTADFQSSAGKALVIDGALGISR